MALDIRYLQRVSAEPGNPDLPGKIYKAFMWDGVSLSDMRDFHALYCQALPNAYVDPSNPPSEPYAGSVMFYYLDSNGDRQGNYVSPGSWIEVSAFSSAEQPNFINGPGWAMVEISGPTGS